MNSVGFPMFTLSSLIRFDRKAISLAAPDAATYSASVDDRAIPVCLRELNTIGPPPSVTSTPEVECLSASGLAQSESLYASMHF